MILVRFFLLFLLSFFFVAGFSLKAFGQLRIDITQGSLEPLRIAILPFANNNNKKEDILAENIVGIISSDLQSSGLFSPLSSDSFAQAQLTINEAPAFLAWKSVNAQLLLQGEMAYKSGGNYTISFRLWDIFDRDHLEGFFYRFHNKDYRRMAHHISDDIYSRLTGEGGYFSSQLIYVAEEPRQQRPKVKRLAIMDSDGHNRRFISRDKGIPQTPRFSPLRDEIVYGRIYDRKADIYWLDLQTGKQRKMRNVKRGLFFSPRFSPDGNSLVVSYALNGNTELWEMDLLSQKTRRLTHHSAIDVSGSYSPDGEKIAFSSDRGGSQQLYVMNRSGGKARRISSGGGLYSAPVWSPRGDLIAFVKQKKGQFSLGVMSPGGHNERTLIDRYFLDTPSWAPNGRVLAFHAKGPSSEGSLKQIYTIDISGRGLRHLKTKENASFPTWSPLRR